MGGELEVYATCNCRAARFTVWLMLSSVVDAEPVSVQTPPTTIGVLGDKTVVVVDDDPAHRGLYYIGDIFNSLGGKWRWNVQMLKAS